MADVEYRRLTCGRCNVALPAGRTKWCSSRCRDGTTMTRAEYREQCRSGAAGVFCCEHCGKTAYRKPSWTNKANGFENRWCSMDCRKEAASKRREEGAFSHLSTGYCATCSAPFVSRMPRRYCSEGCYPHRASIAPESKDCRRCGAPFKPMPTKGRPSEFCGPACLAEAQAGHRRVGKAKRRALTKASTVEAVDPFKVFDRDGWRCQLCGIRTPKAKRGTYEPNAPELDHIVPLSKGGEHSYRNTQCACRQCNSDKGDAIRGQMLLVG